MLIILNFSWEAQMNLISLIALPKNLNSCAQLCNQHSAPDGSILCRDYFVYVPCQWETTLHCNVVSHWLGSYIKWSLLCGSFASSFSCVLNNSYLRYGGKSFLNRGGRHTIKHWDVVWAKSQEKWSKIYVSCTILQWHHGDHDGISNHQHLDCLRNCLFRCRSKKTSKLHITGLCEGNSPVTGEFATQRASNAENVFIWWRHHKKVSCRPTHIEMLYIRVFISCRERKNQPKTKG